MHATSTTPPLSEVAQGGNGHRRRVAAVQMTSGSDVAVNLASAVRLVERAADEGATYIQLPEYSSYWGPASGYAAAAQTVHDSFVGALGAAARRRGATVHIGSMLEPGPDHRFYNTSVVLGPDGTVRATYRKTHLFDVDVPGGVTYLESAQIAPGGDLVVASLGELTLGLSICFDLRFAELYRALALAGANVLAVPAAFSAATGPAHWEVLLRARAIENHAFVVAAAQAGVTPEGLATYGHAAIVNPWGEVLAMASTDDEDVLVVEIDLSEVLERREQIDVLGLRRPGLYETRVREN